MIFKQFGIPVYGVWDSDKGGKDSKPEGNRRLLRLMEGNEEDWPHMVTNGYACFEQNLTRTLRAEIGEDVFKEALEKCCAELSMKEKYAMKHPAVVKEIVSEACNVDARCRTLEDIINRIVSLASQQ